MKISFFSIFICYSFSLFAQNKAFQPGEYLEYDLHYGFISGGVGIISLAEVDFNGKNAYHGIAEGKTVGIVDKLFKVRDVFESYFNPETGLPYKAIRNVREGNYRKYNEVLFYPEDSLAISQLSGEHKVQPDILDMVSTLYYIRLQGLEHMKYGDTIPIVTFFDDEVFPFAVRFKGEETVKIPLGKFRCYRLDPVVEPGRIFESEDDMSVWISKDKNLIPIRVQFDLIVGSVKCDLIKFRNLKYPLIKIK